MSDRLTAKQYTYLFSHISLSGPQLQQWMQIQRFVTEVSNRFENGEPIDDASILPIMEGIYSEYDPIQGKGYHIGGASPADMRRSIRKLYRVLNRKQNE